jgi:hypothetical protein
MGEDWEEAIRCWDVRLAVTFQLYRDRINALISRIEGNETK